MEISAVKIDGYNSDRGGEGHLICPNCDSDYLHHTWVREYARRGEDTPTTVTQLLNGEAREIPRDNDRNPSFRRDGLRVAFLCEGCDAHIELVIAQHKGQTEIWMEHMPEGRWLVNREG